MGLFSIGRKTVDRHTFQEFYKQTLVPLSRHLMSLGLRRDEELEDVLQNTYLEAHKSFAGIKDPHAALAWLFTIGRRQYARYVELRVKQRMLFLDGTHADIIDSRLIPSDERLIQFGLCARVLNQIEQLDNPKKKLALQLFFIDDLPLKEIAEQTATPVSTLTTWISRFRKQVQSEAQEPDEDVLLAPKEVFP